MKIWADDPARPGEEVGYSEIQVVYPSFKDGVDTPTGSLILSNPSALDVFRIEASEVAQ
jgi:hypothetical protein